MDEMNKLIMALERTVPIEDPQYLIGEDEAIEHIDSIVNNMQKFKNGVIGCAVLGQVGNGKTHFLRYVRQKYSSQSMIGMYIPDMFVSGPLVDALNYIYKSVFCGPGNERLSCFINEWRKYKTESTSSINNNIIKYLSLCSNEVEETLVLDYFSGIDLIPDQNKYLRNKFGLKKKLISNELDLYDHIGNALEFIQIVTSKGIMLLFDEVDKIYSAETNKVRMSAVQAKLLTAYRGLFDSLNNKKIKGMVVIGATPEAWDILSTQTAFERRFVNNILVLKVPKTKDDCFEFLENRYKEIGMEFNSNDQKFVKQMIERLDESKRKTWADVLTNMRKNNNEIEDVNIDPVDEILSVLTDAIAPLTWNEIILESDYLAGIYPKSQPTALLKKMEKDNLIRINDTVPKTYESWNED